MDLQLKQFIEEEDYSAALLWIEGKVDDWLHKLGLVGAVHWDKVQSRTDTVASIMLLMDFYYGITFLPGLFNALVAKSKSKIVLAPIEQTFGRIYKKLSYKGEVLMPIVNEYTKNLHAKMEEFIITDEDRELFRKKSKLV
jgi:hypothetical protein